MPNVVSVESIAELRTVDPLATRAVILVDDRRGGTFTPRTDDISARIVGSLLVSTAVDIGTDTITIPVHRLATGYCVLAFSGIATNVPLYVRRAGVDTLTLHTSYLGAWANTGKVDITGPVTLRRYHDPRAAMYVTPESDLSGFSGGWIRQGVEHINVMWAGAFADGEEDDAEALQGAVCLAERSQLHQRGRRVYFPWSPEALPWYRITRGINCTKPVHFVGESRDLARIYADTAGVANNGIINFLGPYVVNLENPKIENMLLVSNTESRADGVYIDTAAYVTMRDVIIRNCRNGITLMGNRTFSPFMENVQISGCLTNGVYYGPGFEGGGHHNWIGCSFSAPSGTGFRIEATAQIAGLALIGNGFEGSARAFIALGSVYGAAVYGNYLEKNGVNYSFTFAPVAGAVQAGIDLTANFGETDGEAYFALLGGAGKVEGFNIRSNYTRDYPNLVRFNGNVAGGYILGNYCHGATSVSYLNWTAPAVAIGNNRNEIGAMG